MGWGALRVWNDDEIAPQSGFPPHPHSDMEIITYVREGAITHKDSMGNTGRTGPGDVQVMSAGGGVRHSEYNLEDDKTTLFQIWIEPTTRGRRPVLGRQALSSGRPVRRLQGARLRLSRRHRRLAYPGRSAGAGRHAEGRRERRLRHSTPLATPIWSRPEDRLR